MKNSSILCASLAANAALAAWLIFHSSAPLPDAVPATIVTAATASVPGLQNKAAATTATGSAKPNAREAAPLPAAPVPIPSLLPSPAVPSPTAAISSLPTDNSGDEPGFLPPLSIGAGSPPVPGRAVDSAAPGNFIRFRGMRAAVAGSYESGTPGDRALAMDFSPEAASESDGGTARNSITPSAATDSGATAPNAATRGGSETAENGESARRPEGGDKVQATGMTREDELFRMKWGWAAYDAAQREARKEAGK